MEDLQINYFTTGFNEKSFIAERSESESPCGWKLV